MPIKPPSVKLTGKDRPTSFRLSKEAKRLLMKLADDFGITQVAVLEILIREKAEEKDLR